MVEGSLSSAILLIRIPPKLPIGIEEAVRQPSESPVCHSEPFGKLRINSAKNLIDPSTYTFEILRLKPQNDVVGQPLRGGSYPYEDDLGQ